MRTITHRYTGEQITFLHTMEETNGEFLFIEVALPPFGKGPPLHVHDAFEEEFEVVTGTLTITVEKEDKELTAGQKIVAPKGVKHTFNNQHDEPVVFRVKLTPGLYFEESARIHYGLMADGLTNDKGEPTKLAHTALILSMQNTLVVALPINVQRKVFRWIVKRSYKKGAYNSFENYIGKPINEVIETLYK
jgi:quercetin dioxygenase-like cupin family protein